MSVKGQIDKRVSQALGAAIASNRKRVGLSQEKLAFEIGMDLTSVNEIEKGHRSPKFTTVYKIAKALKTPLKSLVGEL